MIYKIIDINSLDEQMTAKYFPMLTPLRQKKIISMKTSEERSLAFCSEILARQCLSELCDAPEFSFTLLLNPNAKSVVGNFDAEISIASEGDIVACAVSENFVGISVHPLKPFTFKDAQNKFSDVELRAVFAESSYSFGELINLTECNEKSVIRAYALMSTLKEAYFFASGRGIRNDRKITLFEFDGNTVRCTDDDYIISESFIDDVTGYAISVVERYKK